MSGSCVFHWELIGIRNFNFLINKSKFTKGSIRSQEIVAKGGKRKEFQILLFYFSQKIWRKIKYDIVFFFLDFSFILFFLLISFPSYCLKLCMIQTDPKCAKKGVSRYTWFVSRYLNLNPSNNKETCLALLITCYI